MDILITTEHASSSYNQPVAVIEGIAYGKMDLIETESGLKTVQSFLKSIPRNIIKGSEKDIAKFLN